MKLNIAVAAAAIALPTIVDAGFSDKIDSFRPPETVYVDLPGYAKSLAHYTVIERIRLGCAHTTS